MELNGYNIVDNRNDFKQALARRDEMIAVKGEYAKQLCNMWHNSYMTRYSDFFVYAVLYMTLLLAGMTKDFGFSSVFLYIIIFVLYLGCFIVFCKIFSYGKRNKNEYGKRNKNEKSIAVEIKTHYLRVSSHYEILNIDMSDEGLVLLKLRKK